MQSGSDTEPMSEKGSDTEPMSEKGSDTEPMSEKESDTEGEEVNDLNKTEFKNLIRGKKALEYLQQGLAQFVDREIAVQHYNFMQRLNLGQQPFSPCNCSLYNILPSHTGRRCNRQKISTCPCQKSSNFRRPCPNSICCKMYDFIVPEHRFTNPAFGNCEFYEWTNKHWSIAKCFMSDSKSPSNSAKTTDAAGLLNIIINGMFFQNKLYCNIDPPHDIFSQARETRNEMEHKTPMELTERELNTNIDLFISVLQDPVTLLKDQDAITAVNNLIKLKNNQIHISKKEEKAILEETLERLHEERTKALDDIESSKSGALQTIKVAETEIVKKLKQYEVNATDLEKRVTKTEEELLSLKGAFGGSIPEKRKVKEKKDDDDDSEDEKDDIPIILTDLDERKKIPDTPIQLRAYQEELAKKGSEGHNVIVLAPTNTGKTRVACKIIQDHFQRKSQTGEFGKVIFLVHTEPLAFQQGTQFETLLPYYRTKVITGRVQREKKHLLKDFIDRRDILVVTAQCLVNALKLGEIKSLRDFSLIVIDECHHTNRAHSFNQTMSRYIDLKLTDDFALPQIVGLTASLGVGGYTDYNNAKEYMKGILVNMDAHYLSRVTANLEQLKEYENRAKEHKVIVRKRTHDSYRQAILDIMNEIDVYMINHPSMRMLPRSDDFIKDKCRVPLCRGSEQFIQWLSTFDDSISKMHSDEVIRMLSTCRLHLETYNKSLMLHADARICDAMSILDEFMENEKQSGNETDRILLCHYERLTSLNFDAVPSNPKLDKMEEILSTHLNNKDARCIIFAKTLVLVKALKNWINENESLRFLNARELVGRKKMSRLSQKDVLEYFRNGRHKVIVATSVAEEGLDVTACNLVIRYEYVKNEIARLQSRGRARAKDSRYYVLTEEGSNLLEREEKNEMLEELMERIIPDLAANIEENPVRWRSEIKRMQKENREKEENKEKSVRAHLTNDVKSLHCKNCNTFICLSSDIRLIQLSHHVAINDEVMKKITLIRDLSPEYEDDNLKSDGRILCVHCQRRLGGVLEYQDTEFPLIKIKYFRVIDRSDQRNSFKKWKHVNFKVEKMSLNELDRIVQIRDDYTY